ncbi:DUF3822 family protein [uncultured Muribaculum sp.]|uniref:DUF3822 family protein n=1 Tax=uncultured Muribaculum sp. TaxID=1918613 RepID=UPI0025D10732|nr:DUF3822 family protein [uncultured Muribaculum sp.]
MGRCVIDKEAVTAPGRCHLILDVDDSRLGVAVVDPLAPASMPVWREIPLSDGVAPSGSTMVASPAERLVRMLEEAVYDNPVLLSGFLTVDVMLHAPWFALLPPGVSDSDCRAILDASMPREAADATMIAAPADGDMSPRFIMYADTPLVDFLRRTFSNPTFRHPIEAMASWFSHTDPLGVEGKMLARFSPASLDLMAFGSSGLVFANTFCCLDPADAVYFILAVRDSLGIDADGELLLAGDSAPREAVTPLLRRYVGFAMPLPIPPRSCGGDAGVIPFHVEALLSAIMKNNDKTPDATCE